MKMQPVLLFLPKWYPEEDDVQYGIFNQKHMECAATFARVGVVYIHHNAGLPMSAKWENGLFVVRIFIPERGKGLWNALRKSTAYKHAYQLGIAKVVEALGNPRLVHASVLMAPALAARRYARANKIPYIIGEHWTGYLTGEFNRWHLLKKRLARQLIREAGVITVVSASLRDAMVGAGLPGNYKIVPNVISHMATEPYPDTAERIHLITISDLRDDKKNISGIIEAFSSALQQRKDLHLHIYGDGPDRKKLEGLARSWDLQEPSICFHGIVGNDKIYQAIVRSHYFVMNSRIETFSVVTAEALACGRPVIITEGPGPAEYVTDKQGIIIPKNDVPALERAILRLADNYNHYNPGELGNYAEQKFGKVRVTELLRQVYAHCVPGHFQSNEINQS